VFESFREGNVPKASVPFDSPHDGIRRRTVSEHLF
jgi:hypothetical protein